MLNDTEVWREAHRLLLEHGVNAPVAIAESFKALSASGDLPRQKFMIKVASALEELLRRELHDGECVQ